MAKKLKNSPIFFIDHAGNPAMSEFTLALSNEYDMLISIEKQLQPENISTLCHLWIKHFVTSYEYLLRSFIKSSKDVNELIEVMNDRKPHKERIEELKNILIKYLFIPSDDILDDLLIIIYLRNYLVHGQWTSKMQKENIINSFFPVNINEFTIQHLNRIKHVYEIVSTCLVNRLFIKTTNIDSTDNTELNKFLLSIGINLDKFYNAGSMLEIYRLLYTHLGLDPDKFDLCVDENSNLCIKELEDLVNNNENFNHERFSELLILYVERIRKNMIQS